MHLHLHAFVIQALVKELTPVLTGAQFKDIFSTSKKELYCYLQLADNSYFTLQFIAEASTAFLAFPDALERRSNNRLNQFPSLPGQTITAVIAHPYERSFHLEISDGSQLVFKLHGKNANLLLLSENGPELFRKELENDRDFDLSACFRLADEPVFDSLDTLTASEAEKKYPFLSGGLLPWVKKAGSIENVTRNGYSILKEAEGFRFSFLPEEKNVLATYTSLLPALRDYARLYLGNFFFRQKKQQLAEQSRTRLRQLQKLLSQVMQRQKELSTSRSYRQLGDLLMAHLHIVAPGSNEVTVEDFYTGGQLTIRLNQQLTPQSNAERFYKKAKNQHIEEQLLDEKIRSFGQKIREEEERLAAVTEATEMRSLKPWIAENRGVQDKENTRFKEFSHMGYLILVGKNSKNNDELTMKYAHKNDLWLHARDVSGSHVVIRHKAGQPFPEPVIKKAAMLAAYFSKRKNDTLCPVIYTERKYVRKPKGADAGQVIVEKEKVLMVRPSAGD